MRGTLSQCCDGRRSSRCFPSEINGYAARYPETYSPSLVIELGKQQQQAIINTIRASAENDRPVIPKNREQIPKVRECN